MDEAPQQPLTEVMPEALPDPYPEGMSRESAEQLRAASQDVPRKGLLRPEVASVPQAVKDPAVMLEPLPDPMAAFLGGGSGLGSGPASNDQVLVGLGMIMNQLGTIVDMLKGGSRF